MLLCLTASHKTTGFELLERLSVHTRDIAPDIAGHDECVRGAVVLATCNRFEAYIDMDEPVTAADAIGLEATLLAIESATGVTAEELEGSYAVVAGPDVAEHLFAVASGLESVVVGEGEIAGQVRTALTSARKHGTTSPELERLFQRATEAQRGVKNATALGRAGRSLVRLALELADSRIADWSQIPVLLVGTGSYAAATLAALRDLHAEDITVYSPSGRAEKFAAKHGLVWVGHDDYAQTAAASRLIITCTSVEHHVVDAGLLREGRGALATALGMSRPLRPVTADAATGAPADAETCPAPHGSERHLIIDLGLPRNVNPDVTTVAGIDLLDLETIRLHAPLEELQAADEARQIVQDAAARFRVVGARQQITPAVVALREHVFGLLDAEIARARARGDEDGRTEQSLRHLVGVLLHTPTTRAHQLADLGQAEQFHAALDAMFGIELETDAAADAEGDTDSATGAVSA